MAAFEKDFSPGRIHWNVRLMGFSAAGVDIDVKRISSVFQLQQGRFQFCRSARRRLESGGIKRVAGSTGHHSGPAVGSRD